MELLRQLGRDVVIYTEDFDFTTHSTPLAKLTDAALVEIGTNSIYITDRGASFL